MSEINKVILLKENDIENGLLWGEYIDWCSLFNKTALYPTRSFKDCTKEEIMDWYDKEKRIHKEHMSPMNINHNKEGTKCKCLTCDKSITSKAGVTLGGNMKYTVTCKQNNCTFEVEWNQIYDIPCK